MTRTEFALILSAVAQLIAALASAFGVIRGAP